MGREVCRISGRKKEALDYYRTYLAINPNSQISDRVREYVTQLSADLALVPTPVPVANDSLPTATPAVVEPAPDPVTGNAAAPLQPPPATLPAVESARVSAVAPPPAVHVERVTSSSGRWAALGVGVAGLALTVTGVTLFSLAKSSYDQYSPAGNGTKEEADHDRALLIAGDVLVSVGAAAMVGAIIGGIVAARRPHSIPRAWLSPRTRGLSMGVAF